MEWFIELTNVIYLYEVYVKLKAFFALHVSIRFQCFSAGGTFFFKHNNSAFL